MSLNTDVIKTCCKVSLVVVAMYKLYALLPEMNSTRSTINIDAESKLKSNISSDVILATEKEGPKPVPKGEKSKEQKPKDQKNDKQPKPQQKQRPRDVPWGLIDIVVDVGAGLRAALTPLPDPNENNRLPDKIPNIPTPQEKWFKWLWEKREMRFEYRPLEFVRAYADKYLEGDAKCVKVGYDYGKMNLSKNLIIFCLVTGYAHVAPTTAHAADASTPRADLTPGIAAAPSCVIDATTKTDAASSVVNKNSINGRTISPGSTRVPSDGSDEAEVSVEPMNLSRCVNDHEMQDKELNNLLCKYKHSWTPQSSLRAPGYKWLEGSEKVYYNVETLTELRQIVTELVVANVGINYCVLDTKDCTAIIKTQKRTIYIVCEGSNKVKDSIQRLNASLAAAQANPNSALELGVELLCNKSQITNDVPALMPSTTIPSNSPRNILAERDAEARELKAELAAANNINKAQAAKLAAQAKEIAEFKQKQQRCTCGAK